MWEKGFKPKKLTKFVNINKLNMSNLIKLLKDERKKLNLNLSQVSTATHIDNAIISKIENGQRTATIKQITSFIQLYKLDEKQVISAWLSDKIFDTIKDYNIDFSLNALKVAEERVKYNSKNSISTISDTIAPLLTEIDTLKSTWDNCRPLNGIALEKMKEYFSINYTFDSNKIEGNTLTMQETYLVVREGLTISGKSMLEHLEAVNHFEAIDFIEELVQKNEYLNERVVKQIHYLILKSIDKMNAGIYRKVPVMISGSSHIPPQPYIIAKQMEEVFEFYELNKDKLHPVILAADMHEKIVTIHPFIDGNGRTTRLIMNLVLLMNGFPIANIKGDIKSRTTYYNALEKANTNQGMTDFYSLVAKASIESLKAHINLAG